MQCTHERILGYLHAPFWICMHGFGSGMHGSRFLCMVFDAHAIHDPFGRCSFVHPITLLAQGKGYRPKALADTGATAYSLIDEQEVPKNRKIRTEEDTEFTTHRRKDHTPSINNDGVLPKDTRR